MSAQRYQPVSAQDEDDAPITRLHSRQHTSIPSSPPPSFRSHTSSPSLRHPTSDRASDPLVSDADRTLADAFDTNSDDESVDGQDDLDDRQRALSGRPAPPDVSDNGVILPDGRPAVERRVTQLPVFAPASSNRRYGGGTAVNDGVFANLNAKPERGGEDADEKPPSYEQAAADATPPYWENTILAPGGASSDEVYIDGLPVGSFFSFIWNGMISMSFQLVGFLLTYLLHTTHAAKNGSKAGLGITLLQYGFQMKASGGGGGSQRGSEPVRNDDGTFAGASFVPPPADPNAHDFDPNAPITSGTYIPNGGDAAPASSGLGAMRASDWFAYALMIVGWFILIRAITEYYKARRHEALVLQSPSRGLPVAIVAEGERPEGSV